MTPYRIIKHVHGTHEQYTTFTEVPGGLLAETAVIGGSSWRPGAASVFIPCSELQAAEFVTRNAEPDVPRKEPVS